MSQRAVWILAALTALLVGYVFLFERTSITSKELDQRQGRVLSAFVRDRVDRLELQRAGKTLVLERKPLEDGTLGSWKLLEPVASEADQDAVDQVLGELEWLSARRTLQNLTAADEKAFGLSAPRYRIWYRAGGERHLLAVGNADVHSQGVYVRTEDTTQAFVVPKTLTEALDHPVGHFRDKQILSGLVMAWARKVELDHGSAKLLLTRADATARWWFEAVEAPGSAQQGGSEPMLRGYADGHRIDNLLSALQDLKAARYLEEGPLLTGAKVALAKPELAVRVSIIPDEKREDQAARMVELRVAGACPDHGKERLVQAGDKGPVLCVAEEALKPFEGEFASFRESALLGVEPSQVEAFELSAGERKLSLKRDGENWLSQGKEQVDREAVESWLASLASTRASSFAALRQGKPTARLLLTLAGAKQEALVTFAPEPDGAVPVQRGEEPLLAIFAGGLADALDPAPGRFTSLSPWAEQQPSEFGSVEARSDGLTRSLALVGGVWSIAGKALAPDAELRVRELVKTLLKTRALAYVSEKPRPEHGLGATRSSVVLNRKATPEKPTSPLQLELGADSAHGLYARFDNGPVMEVDARILGLTRELAGGAPPAATTVPDAGVKAHDQDSEHDDDDDDDHIHSHEH
jgi:hypothetical protein